MIFTNEDTNFLVLRQDKR